MISPIRNISFKTQPKPNKNKINQTSNPPLTTYSVNSIYSGGSKINFTGYLGPKYKVTFEYGVENNLFALPWADDSLGNRAPLKPDKKQLECAKNLVDGKSVLFDAPTGMGKTAVAHFAMGRNLLEDKKTIYTVPIKALANDKYEEFSKKYGAENVGILTGDRKINGSAPIVIMTTEIFNNQAQTMTLNDAMRIGTVVFDEAHYIGDSERGIAWEQAMINTASKGVQILALSATIGNADKLASWIDSIPGSRDFVRVNIPPQDRPVPLAWRLYRPANKTSLSQTLQESRFDPIMYGEVDLSLVFEDRSSDVADMIYQIESEYYEKRHENNKGKSWYNDEFLKDEYYRFEIIPKLENALGPDWIKADFLSDEVYDKLKKEFLSISKADLVNIQRVASLSGVSALSDRQRRALEMLFKKEYDFDFDYEMTDEDYEFIYSQLKMGIGEGNNNFRYSTEAFKKRLYSVFPSLSKTEAEFITQSMSRPDVKNISRIQEQRCRNSYYVLARKLQKEDMLPAIFFALSQSACEAMGANLFFDYDYAVEKAEESEEPVDIEEIKRKEFAKINLLTPEERQQVEEIIEKYEQNGVYLGSNPELRLLLAGWGIHHAGRLPQYKKLVEELFDKKLLKVVFATSTLGAGVNMPARTVVISNTAYSAYSNASKRPIQTPIKSNDFHQMAGRAGRRGMDDVGYVVLFNLYSPTDEDYKRRKIVPLDELDHAYNLMGKSSDNVISSFRPQPVMLANHYAKQSDKRNLWDIIKQTFRVYNSSDKQKTEDQMRQKFFDYEQVLLKQAYLMRDSKKEPVLTPKGQILTRCQGMNPLLLASLLYDEKLANMTPVQLAQVAGYIQGSGNEIPSELEGFIDKEVVKQEGIMPQYVCASEFGQTKNALESSEDKILRTLREHRTNPLDIRKINPFGGFVTYLFASMNNSDESDSIENFETIVNIPCCFEAEAEGVYSYYAYSTEGNIYKTIAGSISVLKQIARVCDMAIECEEDFPNTYYWVTLKENALEAIKLLDREPINNEPDYANKL